MTEERNELNEKARIEYGITNAADLDEKALKANIKAIDDQAVEAKKEETRLAKEAEKADEKEEVAEEKIVDVEKVRNEKKK